MSARTALMLCILLYTTAAHSQTLTIAGGQTIAANSTEHDAYRIETNFAWKPEFWRNDHWVLSLNHALSVMSFRDVNNVNAISWAPNIIIKPSKQSGVHPYLQVSFGAAYLSDDKFQSKPRPHPCDCREGVTDMGSNWQFESSLALGLIKDRFSIRAKIYHYSNANLASENEGMDVAELGVSYSF